MNPIKYIQKLYLIIKKFPIQAERIYANILYWELLRIINGLQTKELK